MDLCKLLYAILFVKRTPQTQTAGILPGTKAQQKRSDYTPSGSLINVGSNRLQDLAKLESVLWDYEVVFGQGYFRRIVEVIPGTRSMYRDSPDYL